MKKPFISIVIPVYNVEGYLKECIESIKAQKFTDFEVIFVNDGSIDNSQKEIDENIFNDIRFKSYYKKNEGSGYARNYGFKLAKGEYIYFVDPDDKIKEDGLLKISEYLKMYKVQVLMFGYYSHNLETNEIIELKNKETNFYNTKGKFRKELIGLIEDNSFNAVWNKVYNREWLVSNGILFTNMKNVQDGQFNCELLPEISSFGVLSESVYMYNSNRNGSATKGYKEHFFDNELRMINTFKKNTFNWENKEKYLIYYSNYLIEILFYDVRQMVLASFSPEKIRKKLECNLKKSEFLKYHLFDFDTRNKKLKYIILKLRIIFVIKLLKGRWQ